MQGMWWLLSHEEAAGLAPLAKGVAEQEGGAELLQLAAKQRMNTDVRRAIFCIIMGGEDYVDASERLLRLPLKVVQWPCPLLMPQNRDLECSLDLCALW